MYPVQCTILPPAPTYSFTLDLPLLLLSDIGGPHSLSHLVDTRFFKFFYSGFYGNNTKTQLGLIQPCPRSPCSTAEPSMLQGDSAMPANCDQTQIKPVSNSLFRPCHQPVSTEERSDWNKPIIRGTLRALKLTHVICVFSPGSWACSSASFLLKQKHIKPVTVFKAIIHTFHCVGSLVPILLLSTASLFRWSRSSVTKCHLIVSVVCFIWCNFGLLHLPSISFFYNGLMWVLFLIHKNSSHMFSEPMFMGKCWI